MQTASRSFCPAAAAAPRHREAARSLTPDAAKALVRAGGPRRAYISSRLHHATQQIPSFRHARQAFAFQPHASCVVHSAAMLRQVARGLEGEGLITCPAQTLGMRVARVVLATPTRNGLAPLATPRDGRALHEMNDRVGPLQMITLSSLQRGQGDDVYRSFHATVLVGSMPHEGRHIGFLMDGNNLQANRVMQALREWQAQAGDKRTLDQLTTADFEAFNKAHPALDLYQAAFRAIDLDDMLAASRSNKFGQVRWAYSEANPWLPSAPVEATAVLGMPDAQALAPMIPPGAAKSVADVLRAEPGQIERFPAK